MDIRNTNARPQRPQQPAHRAAAQNVSAPAPVQSLGRKHTPWLLAACIVLVLAIGALVAWKMVYGAQPASDRYQAVFLDNGQTFFGKLKNTHGTYLRLEQAYTTKQQELPKDATDEQKQAVGNNLSLIKVDSVVYGPESTMMIRADQVLFWQNLQEGSKVSKAIDSAN